jgi:mRNA-degrading endonuclease toxin of MazEF toxin-antitoxin module
MPGVSKGEVWLVDFGMVAKVRPALLLTGEPADDELDLVTVRPASMDCGGKRSATPLWVEVTQGVEPGALYWQ